MKAISNSTLITGRSREGRRLTGDGQGDRLGGNKTVHKIVKE